MKIVPQLGVRVEVDGIEGVVGAWLEAIPDREVLTPLVQCTLLVEHGSADYLYTIPSRCTHLEIMTEYTMFAAPADRVRIVGPGL